MRSHDRQGYAEGAPCSLVMRGRRTQFQGVEPSGASSGRFTISGVPPVGDFPLEQTFGTAGYYRQFTPTFGELTSPLISPESASDPVQWMEQCQMAFENVE